MKWTYNGSEEFEVPVDAVGFVYKIVKRISTIYDIPGNEHLNKPSDWTTLEDKIYIGKKLLTSTTKRKVGKRALEKLHKETGDRRKGQRIVRVTKPSSWENYESSCKPLIEDIKLHPELYRKEIICFCHSRKHLSYCEVREQMKYNVLETDTWNDNILGKWFRKDIVKPKTEEK